MRRIWLGTGCLVVALSMTSSMAWSVPRAQYTADEYYAFQATRDEKDPQTQIKRLDDFESTYTDSFFTPYAYQDHYVAFYRLKAYPQTMEYADKLLALDKLDLGMRLQALAFRARAYCIGSGDKSLQTGDAYAKARDAAGQGIRTLGLWQKPPNMTDQQFSSNREGIGNLFNSVLQFVDTRLKGADASCKAPPDVPNPPNPLHFDHMIDDLKTEQRQSPTVR